MSISNCCAASAAAKTAPITGVVSDPKTNPAAATGLAALQPPKKPEPQGVQSVQGVASLSSSVLATLLGVG